MKTVRALRFSLAILVAFAVTLHAKPLTEKEQKRRELNASFDKLHLREKDVFVTETSPEFLNQPTNKPIAGDFSVAKVAPTVKLQILPHLEPEYFSGEDQYMSCWANWAHMTRGPGNRFYFAASDHLAKGCDINLYEYKPGDDRVRRVLDVSETLGWADAKHTDGKVHGHMGVTSDGLLWGATHFGVKPTDQWYADGYRGSWLFSYNTKTGEGKNWGVRLIGNAMPCFEVDTRRGIFLGTGYNLTMLCWDCVEKRVRFAGYPPNGWQWWRRAMLCDEETGKFWGMDGSEEPYHIMSFDPELNRFERYDLLVPDNPLTGKAGKLRGCTTRPDTDGRYYWATWNGTFFRFKPEGKEGPEIEPLGVTWDEGRDTLQLGMGPAGRYVYYQPKGYPSPLVQYDTKTGKKKAIGFLQDYFFEKYGYWLGSQVYGMDVSDDGSFAVVLMNGTFSGRNRSFGHPALAVISIPKEERP